MTKQKFKKYYQNKKVTSTYTKQREATEYRKEKRKRELDIMLDLIDENEGDKILELGCSSGFLTKHLKNVTAIDTSKEMLELTKEQNPNADVLELDMFDIDTIFRPEHFTKVVTIRVWNHLNKKELDEMLKKVRYVLKDGCYLIFDIEYKSYLRKFASIIYKILFNPTGYKVYQFNYKQIEKLLEKNGFRICFDEYLKHKVGKQMFICAMKGGI